ncbi:periplasmic heavy metal sensor [Desulfovibrio sulfodismutans]|uniref:Periplasmic heavy metal sensor n=1 Tax=Desulfolutivibrio sulfodismutans TaxID=63561 RepID=A0A7K3NIU7_9BACT|nr:periplasmic heavy metal sensor [Desulfolutivibrio sulfodismutans]NDY56017.1 periplasmic heavy metal sensor [Desulfolutivibrio sulfodismutans]QLA13254.1 periplasmic heavy metal sensor [Desulfolutivibrio sulfodismutans DSM 3696]
MNARIFKMALMTALLVLAASLPAMARGHGGPGGPGGPGGCPGVMDQLTPEQQAAYQKLVQEHVAKIAPIRAALQVKKAELNVATLDPKADQAKIAGLAKEIGTIKGQMAEEGATFRVKLIKEFGPLAMGGCGGPGMGGGRGPGMGRGPGNGPGCGGM